TVATPFDLASVTKPIVALSLVRLVRERRIRLEESLGSIVPELASTFAGALPIELLLAHRAGLAAHIELFAPLRDGRNVDREASIVRAADSRRPECVGTSPPEGYPPVYSDMGYLLLGLAIERRAGAPLDEIVEREVLAPLSLSGRIGSARQLRARQSEFDRVVAPTEDVAFRGGVVRGVVHDENAFALYGDALAGHAGLFGDARAVLMIGEALLRAVTTDDGWLGPEDLAPLIRPRPGGTLLAGFDGKSAESPSSGSKLGPRTFGHLGFTGTSLWIDPEASFAGVLLSNRVHPTREHIAIRKARPAVYDALFDALGPKV
ncbi:MAG: beta-lactamase family protein, partial [Polyangiaceae bacterium]|nr:beta-lactamase family protein [Polyangiaceae bacterium]